jgi:hypothetical protein
LDGTVYIGSGDKQLHALNSDGTVKWTQPTGAAIGLSAPALDQDGTVYVGSSDGSLYAFVDNSGGIEKGVWAMIKGGPRHVGHECWVVDRYLSSVDDADGDGIPDCEEGRNGLDPDFAGDANEDPDSDSLINLDEYQNWTLYFNPDTDLDGLSDGAEVLTHGTDPRNSDSDGDGLSDGWEVANGGDPLDPLN